MVGGPVPCWRGGGANYLFTLGWSLACARWLGWPRPEGQRVQRPDLIRFAVDHAVDFDGQRQFGAIEIKDVGTDRVLATERQSFELAPFQLRPQLGFRRRQRASHRARTLVTYAVGHGVAPSTTWLLRAALRVVVPLPMKWGGKQRRNPQIGIRMIS